nr:HAD family hydrolase [Psychromicrobium silvestre]
MDAQIRAVLFDIDDTLVDLGTAMARAVRASSAEFVPELSEQEWDRLCWGFQADPEGYYDAFLRGELEFVGQRVARARLAFASVGGGLPDAQVEGWNAAYESEAQRHWQPYPDVLPVLDALDASGIRYGAVSNNVESYQRRKLDIAGLSRISVLVGTDTVGVPKPDPRIFQEGVRQLGFSVSQTLYVGDNLLVDALGATQAGLPALWLNREGLAAESVDGQRWDGPQTSTLAELPEFL